MQSRVTFLVRYAEQQIGARELQSAFDLSDRRDVTESRVVNKKVLSNRTPSSGAIFSLFPYNKRK